MASTTRRIAGIVGAAIVASAAGLVVTPAVADEFDRASTCLAAGNVWVHVEGLEQSVTAGCATSFGTSLEALESAGFSLSDADGSLVIDGIPEDDGEASWVRWRAEAAAAGTLTWWTQSEGASQAPEPGSVEGWRLQDGDTSPSKPPRVPIVTADPQDVTVTAGETATLTAGVVASKEIHALTWFEVQDGEVFDGWEEIEGAEGPELSLQGITQTDFFALGIWATSSDADSKAPNVASVPAKVTVQSGYGDSEPNPSASAPGSSPAATESLVTTPTADPSSPKPPNTGF